MRYDPFARGPFRVGERSGVLHDAARDRRLPYEVWYPEHEARFPMVVHSHSSGGHRRQSSFLCTHLASHGYVVAAADHVGNTAADVAARAASGSTLTPGERDAFVERIIGDRVPDIRALLDRTLGSAGELSDRIDPESIGLVGWSFGGWAVLATPEVDTRVSAVVALAPGGNSKPLPGIIPATLTFAWSGEVPTLFLVAERDRFTPLPGQYELFERTPSAKRMFVLRGADHQHFADDVSDPGPCSADHAHLFARGLALAHFDVVLKTDRGAEEFWRRDVAAALSEHVSTRLSTRERPSRAERRAPTRSRSPRAARSDHAGRRGPRAARRA